MAPVVIITKQSSLSSAKCVAGQAEQKTEDMLAGVAGCGSREVLLALWMVHTKYTGLRLRININTNKATLFVSC